MTSFLPRFASLGLVATAAVASLTLAGAPAEARTNGFFYSVELAEPVAEITIAGTLPEMFRALVPASDLELVRGLDVPTFRIDGMSVAGE